MAKQTKALDNPGSKKDSGEIVKHFLWHFFTFLQLRSLSSTLTSRTATFGSVLYKYRDVSKLEDHVGNFTEEIVEEMINRCVYFHVCFNILLILNTVFILFKCLCRFTYVKLITLQQYIKYSYIIYWNLFSHVNLYWVWFVCIYNFIEVLSKSVSFLNLNVWHDFKSPPKKKNDVSYVLKSVLHII